MGRHRGKFEYLLPTGCVTAIRTSKGTIGQGVRHHGVFDERYWRAHRALQQNRANQELKLQLLAELLFNDELLKTYTSNGFSMPSRDPLKSYFMRNHPDLYWRLSYVWRNGPRLTSTSSR